MALVEVKTGSAKLNAEQIESYIDLARAEGFDAVLSISNEIPSSPGVHPTGVRVRSNSKVALHHMSWTRVLTTAVMEKVHRGIDDPEQAWILGELIRYLKHPASGATGFDDMGESWTAVRDGARDGTLNKDSDQVVDIAQRWDQLLGYASLSLGADIGEDVIEVVPRAQQLDPSVRTKAFVDSLVSSGTLEGTVRIPNTISDLHIVVDLKARLNVVTSTFDAPGDKGGRGRVGWLVRQLADAPADLVVEAYSKNARTGLAASLGDLRDDPTLLIGSDRKEPVKFALVARSELGVNRRSGRKPGFTDSVIKAIEAFYGDVLQHLVAFQPKAPKLSRPIAPEVQPEPLPSVELVAQRSSSTERSNEPGPLPVQRLNVER